MQTPGRVFIVTGSSSGIGAALVRALVGADARVALAARRRDVLERIASDTGRPDQVAPIPTDITRHEDLERLVEATLDRFGALHGVVHCAGVGVTARLEASAPEELEALVRVNLLAPIWLTRLALPALRREHEAVIAFVSSMSAVVGGPPLQSAYTATKQGLATFGDVLRRDLEGTGVRVVTVYPGVVDTPMIADLREAQGRVGFVSPVPMQRADEAAAEILAAILRPRPEVILGGWRNRLVAMLARRVPWAIHAGMRRMRPEIERLAEAEAAIRAERRAPLTPR